MTSFWKRWAPRGGPGAEASGLSPETPWPDVERRERGSLDYQRLGRYLAALTPPNRLELLRKLQVPLASSEIRLTAVRRDRERREARAISRQAVEAHLRKLEALGLVQSRAAEREGRPVTEYVVNHARLFMVVEELRRLSLIRAPHQSMTAGGEASIGGGLPMSAPMPAGPALVLAGGPLEGATFPLAGPGPWRIGRDKDLAVALPYDPFVSRENTELRRQGGAFVARALPGTRNGTRINWQPLAEGDEGRLAPGDALGVGRSLLFLRGA